MSGDEAPDAPGPEPLRAGVRRWCAGFVLPPVEIPAEEELLARIFGDEEE